MDSRHLVDSALLPLLEAFPTDVITHQNLADRRANRLMPSPIEDHGVSLERRTVPGPAGAPDIDLLIYRPRAASGLLPCIYHMHGGGYIVGAVEEFEFFHRPLVADLGCVLVSVNYRLAPETIFPGPIEDCYAGLGWTIANAAELGIDTRNLGVMGESAGGGLAASLALLTRDRGEYSLSFQHLIYPMLDDRTCTAAEPHPYAGEFIWHASNNHFGWSSLLGHEPGIEGVSPYAAAARVKDVGGLPPTFISVGALDLFLEENIDYARRLLRAGVPTEFHIYPGAFHAFDILPGSTVADAARQSSRAALSRALARNA